MDVANKFVPEKAKRAIKKHCWQICPHKGVVFDQMHTKCGMLNSVSIYLRQLLVSLAPIVERLHFNGVGVGL